MKKLVLAPAVALAITGLGAAPVIAADLPAASAGDTQPASASAFSQKAVSTPSTSTHAGEIADAAVTVTPKQISQSDLVTPGVTLTVTGLEAGDTVTDTLTGDKTVAEGDTVEYGIYNMTGDPEAVEPGMQNFEVTITRGADSRTVGAAFEVISDDAAAVDPAIKLESTELTADEFNANGLPYTASGLTPGGNAIVSAAASGTSLDDGFFTETPKADADGKAAGTITLGDSDPLAPGTYLVQIEDQKTNSTAAVEFTLTDAGDVSEDDPTLAITATTYTAEEVKNTGVTVTGEGFTPNGSVKVIAGSAQAPFGSVDVKADENGAIKATVKSEELLPAGEYSTWAVDAETENISNGVTFTVTAAEAPAEASLTVTPKKIEGADFIDSKKGVTLAVENCKPGEDVHFVVNPKGQKVAAFDTTEKADENGKAAVSVYGTTADAETYLGDYTVTVTCGDETLKDAFSVVPTGKAGGDDGDDGKDSDDDGNGGDLPRTGAELTGLATGGALLLLGGAAVTLTLRRKKVAQGPSEF